MEILSIYTRRKGLFYWYTGKGWGPGVYKGVDISKIKLNQLGTI